LRQKFPRFQIRNKGFNQCSCASINRTMIEYSRPCGQSDQSITEPERRVANELSELPEWLTFVQSVQAAFGLSSSCDLFVIALQLLVQPMVASVVCRGEEASVV